MKHLTRGELAKKAGVNPETVRYYEKLGLLPEAIRTESGYRLFSEEDVKRIKFIKRAKELGFTLKEIKELLQIRFETKGECRQVKKLAEEKLSDIQKKIDDLEKIKETLQHLIEKCPEKGSVLDCPIISTIED